MPKKQRGSDRTRVEITTERYIIVIEQESLNELDEMNGRLKEEFDEMMNRIKNLEKEPEP